MDKKFHTKPEERKLSLKLMELPRKRKTNRDERRDMTIESLKPQFNSFAPISLAFIGDYSMNIKKVE